MTDCEAIVTKWRLDKYERFQAHRDNDNIYQYISIDIAEQAFIIHYQPCFNTRWNAHPISLPKQYQVFEPPVTGRNPMNYWIQKTSEGDKT
jgi:hypothetical protein